MRKNIFMLILFSNLVVTASLLSIPEKDHPQFKTLDTNKDGKISMEEWDVNRDKKTSMEKWDADFKSMDSNHDDQLSDAEMKMEHKHEHMDEQKKN